MRFRTRLRLATTLSLLGPLVCVSAHTQQPSPWQGEWGAFTGSKAETGRRLSIHDCSGNTCRFSIEASSLTAHAGTASDATLTLQSETTASADLPGDTSTAHCTLHFQRPIATLPVIEVQAVGSVCVSYYATGPAVSLGGIYPQRSTQPYNDRHADECFLGTSPALLATCTHPAVAALERTWEGLADEYPLHALPRHEPGAGSDETQLDAQLLHSCDTAPDPVACLTSRYTDEIASMQARQAIYLAGTTQRGDPTLGDRLARKIAGHYRHSEPNGDVDGHHYITTDTLTIRPVGQASLHFAAELNFFNGHTCSLAGGALFRQDGSFVFDDKPENAYLPNTPACRLALIPNATGIHFRDITGGCKNYCGERGNWNGKGFLFTQRTRRSQPRTTNH